MVGMGEMVGVGVDVVVVMGGVIIGVNMGPAEVCL